jgi:hypothetical protein
MEKMNKKVEVSQQPGMTRKEALQKGGKYAALTAATMLFLLSTPAKAQTSSPEPPPDGPF